jgi:hypothetical protein
MMCNSIAHADREGLGRRSGFDGGRFALLEAPHPL